MIRFDRSRLLVYIAVIGGCVSCSGPSISISSDRRLSVHEAEERIATMFDAFEGVAGIFVYHVSSGASVELNADTLFPTASMIKVPILATVFDRMERGTFGYHDRWEYRDSLRYPGVDLLASFKEGRGIPPAQVVLLMITLSDNTAALWCQEKVGGGSAVNEWLAANGFERTRVNSRTPGRGEDWEAYGWGQTTPREMASMLLQIRHGRLVSPAASEEMDRILSNQYWNDEALSRIPPYVQVIAKSGAVSASKSEVVLASPSGGDYVFCIVTKNQADTRWTSENEGYRLIREVSSIIWRTFGDDPDWEPAEGMERYWEP